ncbi:type II secretion system protein [Candidatus Saccharibacteria bacterium]|nr:MAG: type II secretion system protein [Candidatus Saccharibacteria bacterium]
MSHNNKQTGFTLIELMLAMVFVAFILVFISLTLVQMFRIYDKGSSMKQVNQAGRSIVEEVSQAIRSQLPTNIDTSAVNVGVLCIDKVMYIWNPLYTADTGAFATSAAANQPVMTNGAMMARKILQGSGLCPDDLVDALSRTTTNDTQLLSGQTRVLRSRATPIDNTRLVKLEFTIGTYSRSEIVVPPATPTTTKYITPTRPISGGDIACLPGNDGNYCSFAEFSTVVYVAKDQ